MDEASIKNKLIQYADLKSQIVFIDKMLSEIKPDQVIDRMSLENRRQDIQEELITLFE